MKNIVRTEIPISELMVGMTVEQDGKLITVSKNDLKYDSFLGYSFRGDAYKKYITKINFIVPTNLGVSIR